MSMEKQMEMAQLLARFKLQVKRSLGQSVDLEGLTRNPVYAKQRLAEIEDAAEDEGLIVMVLRLRDFLIPVDAAVPAAREASLPPVAEALPNKETRSYLMGARAW